MAILKNDQVNEYKLFYNSWRDVAPRLAAWQTDRAKLNGTRWPNKFFNYGLQKIAHYPKLDRVIGGVDVFWSPHFNFTSLSRRPKHILTVHDLSFLRYPEFFSKRQNLWHRALNVKNLLRSADYLIAVSENTKQDIMELAGVAADRIRVIYSGNNLEKREVPQIEAQKFFQERGLNISPAGETPCFVLYLGNIEPRKNIEGLISAYNQLRASCPELSQVQLILAGGTGWKNGEIYQSWHKSPYQESIKFLGYINQAEKEILYSQAAVLAYPSFYEGFGFPPLEALTYGLPVVASSTSSLPEVVGQAALLVNPYKTGEIIEALKIALTDQVIRERLQTAGPQRALNFSWEKTAREYLQLFKEML